MKRSIVGFINGFVACMMLFYTAWNYVLFKWARGKDIRGIQFDFIRKPIDYSRKSYKDYKPNYRYYSDILKDEE